MSWIDDVRLGLVPALDEMESFFRRAARRQQSPMPPPIPDGGLRSLARASLKAARGGAKADGTPADAPPRTRAELAAEAYRRALSRQRFLADQAAVRAAQAAGPPPDSIAGGAPIRDVPDLLKTQLLDGGDIAEKILALLNEHRGVDGWTQMSVEERRELAYRLIKLLVEHLASRQGNGNDGIVSEMQEKQGQFSLATIQSPPGQPPQFYLMSEERRREVVAEWCKNGGLRW
jgi:hypothetical protein